jgi:glyoxylase-like metal-dependent hydrolase (beta-lactamase superfamily II)
VILERVTHPRWRSNTWLVAAAAGGEAVIVDAGGPVAPLVDRVRQLRLRVGRILITHHHVDHAGEIATLKQATGARVGAHRLEAPLLETVDDLLEDGEAIAAGGLKVRVLHIPGHTAGQAAFLVDPAGGEGRTGPVGAGPVGAGPAGPGATCFTGDTLFRGSVGSTTAPGHTTFADLRRSLVERLLALPDAVQVAPGHAEPTTIGEERATNPFLRVMIGAAPEGDRPGRYASRDVRVVVWARDYDGGFKAWVRFADGGEDTVPGSRVDLSR